MADYIYLLENRLSPAQRGALRGVRDVARAKGLTVFLVGGAVRDLTSGSPVRDLDVVVQGNALKLKKDIEKAGGVLTGEMDAAQALFFLFPGNVRVEVGSTLSVTFPKPGKAVMKPATILDDLRRRDFTANAMALSLNEGSYGLLMDPLNGVADIENRELRLVSNYGFIEDPVRMIRAARLMARLSWVMDERTQARYETGQHEGYIGALSEYQRGYETEEIVHEEDPLRVMRRLEAEGWMKVLAPYWTSAKVNAAELDRLRDVQAQLELQGIQPDTAAAMFPLLTAKLTAKEVATLKAGFARPGFVREIDALEGEAKAVAAELTGKGATLPSQSWRLMMAAKPEAMLWMAYSTKSPALQAKLKSFSAEWPQARHRMPYALMQEMRITPELSGYEELLEKLFFELMDGKLTTPEEMKAFLEPYSPPAPPPPVNLRRSRSQKKDGRGKSRAKKAVAAESEDDDESTAQRMEQDEAETAGSSPDASGDSNAEADDGEASAPMSAETAGPEPATETPVEAVHADARRESGRPASGKTGAGKTGEAATVPVKAGPGPGKGSSGKGAGKTAHAKAVSAVQAALGLPASGEGTRKQKAAVGPTKAAVTKKTAAAPAKKAAAPAKKTAAAPAKKAPAKAESRRTPAKAVPVKGPAKSAAGKSATKGATHVGKSASAKPKEKPAGKAAVKAGKAPVKAAKTAAKKSAAKAPVKTPAKKAASKSGRR